MRGGKRAKSHDGVKALSSTNHSIFSDLLYCTSLCVVIIILACLHWTESDDSKKCLLEAGTIERTPLVNFLLFTWPCCAYLVL
jgi:hypothetical protein